MRPHIFYPHYALGRLPTTGAEERQALRAFGKLCAQAFVTATAFDPARTERIAQRRAEAESGQISVLGYGRLPLPTGDGWHADPIHGHSWPRVYFPGCDFLSAGIRADVKIPWEMSRLQALVWFAEAAVAAAPEDRASLRDQALGVIFDWTSANPPGYGVNWTCGMEVAIRGANMAVVAGVFADTLDDATTDRLCAILRAHQLFLARFPEVSDVPGNHYLTDLMGEVVLHAALDGLHGTATARAFAHFAKACEPFEPDGCHLERATVYHRLTLDIVALPYTLALRAGDASARMLTAVMERAAAFMAQITNDGGMLPVFGDQDSGFVLWFGETAQRADARLCAAPMAPQTDLYSFLAALSGDDAAFFPAFDRQDGSRSGFATLSGEGFRVTMKTGPIGLKGRAAHDHDDALSVAVSHGAEVVLVDPGCHSYTLDPAIRQEALVSSRHNAPAPAERERYATTMGSINATVRGAPTAVLVAQEASAMTGRLESTRVSRMALTRSVRLEGGALEVVDHWRFETSEGARLLWLVNPTWLVEGPEDSAIPSEGLVLRLHCGATTLTARLFAPEGAWLTRHTSHYSPDYGAWEDCPALMIATPLAQEGQARLILSALFGPG
jgi:hypothetical protein